MAVVSETKIELLNVTATIPLDSKNTKKWITKRVVIIGRNLIYSPHLSKNYD